MAMAQAPLWLRNAKISPNGQEIVFTYKGDLYKVATGGGQALQLTSLPSYETAPVWNRKYHRRPTAHSMAAELRVEHIRQYDDSDKHKHDAHGEHKPYGAYAERGDAIYGKTQHL